MSKEISAFKEILDLANAFANGKWAVSGLSKEEAAGITIEQIKRIAESAISK